MRLTISMDGETLHTVPRDKPWDNHCPPSAFREKYISVHWHIYQENSQILTLFKSFQGISCLVLLVFSSCLKFLPNFRDFFWATIHMLKSLVSVLGKQKILPSLINKKSQYRRHLLCAKYPMDYYKIANR